MAQCQHFSHLTNLFFSTLPNEYELSFKEELWGCYKYIGISLETLYNMPIQERKFFIHKHNMENKQQEGYSESANGEIQHEYSGESLNAFAKTEQQKNG